MKITNSEEHDRAVRQLKNLNGWIAEKTTAESLRQALLAEHAELAAALDDYYQRENTEWEKAKMSEERKPLVDAEKLIADALARWGDNVPLGKHTPLGNLLRGIVNTYEKRIAELEAAQRPANPAGDDIAELVNRARVSLYDPAASYEESIACATVAMAMMRLREYEA